MPKRRILKKNINCICSELFAECVALTHYKTTVRQADVDNVMGRILLMHDDFISRISHTEPGRAKQYYAKLRSDFNAQIADIADILTQLS